MRMEQNAAISQLYTKTADLKVGGGCATFSGERLAAHHRQRANRYRDSAAPCTCRSRHSRPAFPTCSTVLHPQVKAVSEYVDLLLENGQKFLICEWKGQGVSW